MTSAYICSLSPCSPKGHSCTSLPPCTLNIVGIYIEAKYKIFKILNKKCYFSLSKLSWQYVNRARSLVTISKQLREVEKLRRMRVLPIYVKHYFYSPKWLNYRNTKFKKLRLNIKNYWKLWLKRYNTIWSISK